MPFDRTSTDILMRCNAGPVTHDDLIREYTEQAERTDGIVPDAVFKTALPRVLKELVQTEWLSNEKGVYFTDADKLAKAKLDSKMNESIRRLGRP